MNVYIYDYYVAKKALRFNCYIIAHSAGGLGLRLKNAIIPPHLL